MHAFLPVAPFLACPSGLRQAVNPALRNRRRLFEIQPRVAHHREMDAGIASAALLLVDFRKTKFRIILLYLFYLALFSLCVISSLHPSE